MEAAFVDVAEDAAPAHSWDVPFQLEVVTFGVEIEALEVYCNQDLFQPFLDDQSDNLERNG